MEASALFVTALKRQWIIMVQPIKKAIPKIWICIRAGFIYVDADLKTKGWTTWTMTLCTHSMGIDKTSHFGSFGLLRSSNNKPVGCGAIKETSPTSGK